METIIPCWEWRTFGPHFRRAEAVFASMEPKDVQESDEVYLLTETGSNVKIRYELLDIKTLQKVNDAGLEQWIAVMKADFPLAAATVDEVFKAMKVATPPLERSEYSQAQFLAELVEPHPRRARTAVLAWIAGFAMAVPAAGPVMAQAYPAKPIRLIVPVSPGGGSDVPARIFAQAITDEVGWRFVIDNRAGAAGRIGTEMAARAPADGYTLLLGGSTPNAVVQSSARNLPYDTLRDFVPVSLIARSDFILAAHPSLPVKSVKDLIALARARPGQINFGSVGNLSGAHVTGELLKQLAKVNIVHVPYKALAELNYRVLLIDLDPQANLSLALGLEAEEANITSASILIEGAALHAAVRKTEIRNLDIIPSSFQIENAEQFLPMRTQYLTTLRDSLEAGPLPYDYILLDCPPALGAITLNALAASNLLIIPTQAEYFSAYALRNMMGTIRRIRQDVNPGLAYRILVTLLDRRNRTHRNIFEQLQATFGQGVFTTVIEIDTKLRESPIAGIPITHYKPTSRSSQQYRVLAQELIEYAKEEANRQAA